MGDSSTSTGWPLELGGQVLGTHTPEQVFEAVRDPRAWQSAAIEGRTCEVGDEFRYASLIATMTEAVGSVGVKVHCESDSLVTVGGGAHHLDAIEEPEHQGQTLADDSLVVCDEDADRFGNTGTSRSKPLEVVSVVSVPPSSSARSRMPVRP